MLCMMRTPRAEQSREWLPSWLIVLCKMKQNEVKSVLCEMKICTLLKTVYEEASANPLFSQNHRRDTPFLSLLLRRPWQKAYLTWYLENTDLKNSDQRPEKLKPSGCFKNSHPKKENIFSQRVCWRTNSSSTLQPNEGISNHARLCIN